MGNGIAGVLADHPHHHQPESQLSLDEDADHIAGGIAESIENRQQGLILELVDDGAGPQSLRW